MKIKEWDHQGIQCLILQHDEMGHLCGYLGVPETHSWFNKKYNQCLQGCERVPYDFSNSDMPESANFSSMMNKRTGGHWPCHYEDDHPTPESIIEVHGGLTFSGSRPEANIQGLWWFGFDCSHSGDYSPGLAATLLKVGHHDALLRNETYRDESFVTKELESCTSQLQLERANHA